MTEIDLIPSDYRFARWQRRFVRRIVLALVAIVSSTVVAGVYLSRAAAHVQEQVATLEAERAVTREQRAELESLSRRRADHEQQLSLLKGLRSGAAADTMFSTIDGALGEHAVWFSRWQFQRAGVLVNEAQLGVETGYFIVIPEDQQNVEDGAWQVETRMIIQGQSLDHAALSKFVDGLFAQPEIVDVRVRQTSAGWYAQRKVVDFELGIVLNSDVED